MQRNCVEVYEEVGSVQTDSEGNTCPFCVENGFVNVIHDTKRAYLVRVVRDVDGNKVEQTGRYFIIPKRHIESILERPDKWTKDEKVLLWRAIWDAQNDGSLMRTMGDRELTEALNTSWNNGRWAGQRVRHVHMWVIFRYDGLEIGMDGMIEEICGRRDNEAVAAEAQRILSRR